MKTLKLLVFIVGGTVSAAITSIVIFLATVDPNDHKSKIESQFKTSTGKTLHLNGAIEFSVWPKLVIEASNIIVDNEEIFDASRFVQIRSIRLSIDTFKLMMSTLELDTLAIDGLKVNLLKKENGRANWLIEQNAENSEKKQTSSELLAIFLGGINIKNSEVKYHEEGTNRFITASDINIKVSQLSFDKPIELIGSVRFEDTAKELKGDAEVLGSLNYDLRQNNYILNDLQLSGTINSEKYKLTEEKFSLFLRGELQQEKKYLTIDELQFTGLKAKLNTSVNIPLGDSFTKSKGMIEFESRNLRKTLEVLAPEFSKLSLDKSKQKANLNLEFETDPQTGNLKIDNLDAQILGTAIEGNMIAENMFSSKPKMNGNLKVNTLDFLPLLKVYRRFDKRLSEGFLKQFSSLKNRSLGFIASVKTLPKQDMIVLDKLQLDALDLRISSNLQITQLDNEPNIDGVLAVDSENLDSILFLSNFSELSKKLSSAKLNLKFTGDSENLTLTPSFVARDIYTDTKILEATSGNISINLEDGDISITDFYLTGLGSKTKFSSSISDVYQSPTGKIQMNASGIQPRKWLNFLEINFVPNHDSALRNLDAIISAQLSKDSIRVSQLDISLDDSFLTGHAKIEVLPQIRTEFELKLDKIDLDKYLTKKEDTPLSPETVAIGATMLPNDFLRSLNGKGAIQINNLKISDLSIENLIINGQANSGKIEINPIEATLYEGKYLGVVRVDATKKDTEIILKTDLNGIEIGPLLFAKAGSDYLQGNGKVALQIEASGKSTEQLASSARGNILLTLKEGVITGVDAPALLNTVEKILECKCFQAPPQGGKTTFKKLKASMEIGNATLKNNDFLVEGQGFIIEGHGSANLMREQLKLDLSLAVPRSRVQNGEQIYNLGGYSIPVNCNGNFQNPSCKPNLQPLLKKIVKNKAKEEIEKVISEKIKNTIGSDAEKALKKLFNF